MIELSKSILAVAGFLALLVLASTGQTEAFLLLGFLSVFAGVAQAAVLAVLRHWRWSKP